ncbi:ABC transporter permease [bacterium]|nr:MAG: ABC transporter permease [bacterium]
MKSFRGFVIKEFYHIFRDKRTMLILFGMPVIQLILFGFAIRNEINDANISIVDHSNDYVTLEIKQKLLSSGYFLLKDDINKDSDMEAVFRKGIVKEVIVFEPEFAQRLLRDGQAHIQIIADANDPNMANLLIGYTSSIIQEYQLSLKNQGELVPQIVPEVKMLYNPELKSVFMFVPGLVAVILMLVSALMTSITITREKELGTMEILLVSPLKPYEIIVGKVLPYLFLSFVNTATIIILARFVFDVPFKGSYILFFIEALLFVVTALSLGIMISTISKTQQTAMMIALAGLMLPVIILSGFIFPVSSMPWPLQIFSNIVPAKWFLIIVKGIMLRGIGLEYLWKETLILGGMTLFFMAVSLKKFKIRLQ